MATTHHAQQTYAPAAGEYALDTTHSYVSFSARHLMVTKVRGRFPVTEGKLVIAENPAESSVEATIDISAVESGDPKRDEHLRSADFFDVEQYPKIEFVSKKVEARGGDFVLTGDLTVHGVTREVTWDLEFDGVVQDPWGGTRAGFSATIEVNRKDWGLEWNVALEAGGLLVSDKVRLNVEIEAVKQ